MSAFLAIVVTIVLWANAAYLCTISLYMLVICVGAWGLRLRSPSEHRGACHRFAILVPAHNEEAGIQTTIRDLLASEYPNTAFTIFVIADNCSDGTADVAARAGATVLVRDDHFARGKGQALDWALQTLASELAEFDLVAFVDADMYVDPDFLSTMSRQFANDLVQVAQARYTVSNPAASWLTALGFVSFAYVNHVRPAGRNFWGGTAELKGSGMVFRRALISNTGWPAGSIAEDVDFGKDLLLRGITVIYTPDAIVTSDIPSGLKQVAVQQSRWEGGKLHVFRKFFGQTLSAFGRTPTIALADAVLDLFVPPLSIIAVLSILGFALASFIGNPSPWLFVVPIGIFAVAVLTGLVQLRPPLRTYLYLAAAPAFLVWKLFLLATIALRPPETEWKRTPRGAKEK
jgi:1,2-diacylglycerol 3-beta-glucosyltransferase